jgi:hypothetical protein
MLPFYYSLVTISAKRKPAVKRVLLFPVARYNYPGWPIRLPLETVSRLHLLYLLDLQSSPTVLPSLLSNPVETSLPHQKCSRRIRTSPLLESLPGMPNLIKYYYSI